MYLPGVGPKKKEILSKELGINSYGDLLEYYPYKYVDRSKVYHISELTSDMPYVQIKGKILSYEEIDTGKRNKMLVAHFSDGYGVVDLTWFRGAQYIMKTYKVGTEYLVFGKPTVFNGRYQFTHPDMDDATNLQISEMGMQPYYSTTEKMKKYGFSSRTIEKITKELVRILPPLPETLPASIVDRLHLVSHDAAFRMIHYPHSHQEMQKAQVRLKFEELFYVQLNILRYASDQRRKYRGYVFNRIADIFNGFYADHLPFELTGAQKRVMHEIRADMCSGRQMNRLLQGDVGSGKTLVALMTMLIALDNGYQACMMAPTEILAEQHLQTIRSFLKGMDIRVELLTGIVKGKKREKILSDLTTGDIQILVGTHAVLEDPVVFQRLGIAVIDEQHRFGVRQRGMLAEKAFNPHLLVMSATPIPRTLGLLIYGDLDISILDELPPGRTPVKTRCITGKKRHDLYHFLDQEIGRGRQVYLVCPAIEDVPDGGLNAVKTYYEDIAKALLPDRRVGLMHGKLKPKEKAAVMEDFKAGRLDALVSTTVIEVGVDVPNASVMVIENAERYGLSALHQLRGRVGRGAAESWCFLVSDNTSEAVQKRLKFLCSTTDGFAVAQYDLETRGPGDFFGSRQHGLPTLQIADLMNDTRTLHAAQSEAAALLAADPLLESPAHALLAAQVQQMFDKAGPMN